MSPSPTTPLPRDETLARLLTAVRADARITGVLEYGSASQSRADEWSDIDLVFVTGDAATRDALQRDWRAWLAGLASAAGLELLLAYVGIAWTPCAALGHPALPVRLDFTFYHEEEACEKLPTWEIRPRRVEDLLLLDRSAGGRLRAAAERLLATPVKEFDFADAFERTAGDFWYFQLRAAGCLARGHLWGERHNHQILVERLAALLRLRHGATAGWRTRNLTYALEKELPRSELAPLSACIRVADAAELAESLRAMAKLGRRLCEEIAAAHDLPWPERLAGEVGRVLATRLG